MNGKGEEWDESMEVEKPVCWAQAYSPEWPVLSSVDGHACPQGSPQPLTMHPGSPWNMMAYQEMLEMAV
jgi:hypothetical protein